MDYEIKEMIVWLLLEYRSTNLTLNVDGLIALANLREKWNIEKADKVFATFCEGAKSIRKEAVKEFAEKLKEKCFNGYQVGMKILNEADIDNLLKEYGGE